MKPKMFDEQAEVKPPFVRGPYNYNTATVSDLTGLSCGDESLAVQDAAEECDINTIMRKFGQGDLPNKYDELQYPDFTGVKDFQSAMNAVREAGESFMMLPATLRAEFKNDPAEFLSFVQDDKNRDRAVQLGLVPPKPPADQPEADPTGSSKKEGDNQKVSPSTVTASEKTVPAPKSGA